MKAPNMADFKTLSGFSLKSLPETNVSALRFRMSPMPKIREEVHILVGRGYRDSSY